MTPREAWEEKENQLHATIVELRATVEKLEAERDLAIAHDRQPYPTAHAYEQVCKALESNKQQLATVTAERDALKEKYQDCCDDMNERRGWVGDLEKQLAAANATIADLQAQWHYAATCDADLDYVEENRTLKATLARLETSSHYTAFFLECAEKAKALDAVDELQQQLAKRDATIARLERSLAGETERAYIVLNKFHEVCTEKHDLQARCTALDAALHNEKIRNRQMFDASIQLAAEFVGQGVLQTSGITGLIADINELKVKEK